MDWIWIWVAIIAASIIIELITMEMVSLWTAVGGLCALILDVIGVNLEIQLVVFFVVSIALLLSLRKLALKYLLKSTQKVGNERVFGTKARLLTEITNETPGTIKVNGVIWSATTTDGTPLAENTIVEIVELRGNKFIVKKED